MSDLVVVRRRARSLHVICIRSLVSHSLLALLVLTGFTPARAAGPATERAADPPATSRASSPVRGSTDLLEAAVLERAAYVRDVLRANPTIESARQSWRAAAARARQAGSLDDPMLELGVAPLSISAARVPFGYEAALRQRLPWFGKRSLEASVASAEASAAKSDYEGVRRELALGALTLYGEYFVAARSLEINAAHVELVRALRDSALGQLESGRGSAQDVLQAETELTHMEHDAVILAAERDVKVAQMNELLHRAPQLPLPPPPGELSPVAAPDSALPSLEAEALNQRPDIAAARQRVRGEEARARRAERDHYPDVTLSASYNSMWDMPEHRWMLGLEVNLPVQLAQRRAAIDEARAMRSQYESDVARLTSSARTQLFVLVRRIEESRHILGLFQNRLLPVARERIDAARAALATSQGPFASVIEAERNLRQVELDHQLAQVEYQQRQGELERALGRIPGLDAKAARP